MSDQVPDDDTLLFGYDENQYSVNPQSNPHHHQHPPPPQQQQLRQHPSQQQQQQQHSKHETHHMQAPPLPRPHDSPTSTTLQHQHQAQQPYRYQMDLQGSTDQMVTAAGSGSSAGGGGSGGDGPPPPHLASGTTSSGSQLTNTSLPPPPGYMSYSQRPSLLQQQQQQAPPLPQLHHLSDPQQSPRIGMTLIPENHQQQLPPPNSQHSMLHPQPLPSPPLQHGAASQQQQQQHQHQQQQPHQPFGYVSTTASTVPVHSNTRRAGRRRRTSSKRSLEEMILESNIPTSITTTLGPNMAQRNQGPQVALLTGVSGTSGLMSPSLAGAGGPTLPLTLPEPPLATAIPADPNAMQPDPQPRPKKKSKYSTEQDAIILQLKKEGKTWNEISQAAKCGNALAARNRYQVLIGQQGGGAVVWDTDDAIALKDLLEQGEKAKWEFIASELSRARSKNISSQHCQKKIKELFEQDPTFFGVVLQQQPQFPGAGGSGLYPQGPNSYLGAAGMLGSGMPGLPQMPQMTQLPHPSQPHPQSQSQTSHGQGPLLPQLQPSDPTQHHHQHHHQQQQPQQQQQQQSSQQGQPQTQSQQQPDMDLVNPYSSLPDFMRR